MHSRSVSGIQRAERMLPNCTQLKKFSNLKTISKWGRPFKCVRRIAEIIIAKAAENWVKQRVAVTKVWAGITHHKSKHGHQG